MWDKRLIAICLKNNEKWVGKTLIIGREMNKEHNRNTTNQ